jgi:hypothetical protein
LNPVNVRFKFKENKLEEMNWKRRIGRDELEEMNSNLNK